MFTTNKVIQLLNRASTTASQTAALVLQKNSGRCTETGVLSTPIRWLPSVHHRKHYMV